MKEPLYGNYNPSRKVRKVGDMIEMGGRNFRIGSVYRGNAYSGEMRNYAKPELVPAYADDTKRLDQHSNIIREKRRGDMYRVHDHTPELKHMDELNTDTVQVIEDYRP